MARFIYGGGGDGDIIRTTGVPYINATANVWDARTGGSQVTDLQNIAGAGITTITTDAFGQAIFYGPDNYIGVLWLDFGSGVRWALSPKAVDLASSRAIALQRAADAAAPVFTTKAALPYNTADPLEQALAAKLDALVIPRFASSAARDAAFPAPANGDRCWRTDLACEQIYNGPLGLWRNSNFAFDVGSVGGSVTLSNTSTETALAILALPAGYVTAGTSFRVTAFGTAVPAASTAPTFTLRLRMGGTTGPLMAANSYTTFNSASPATRAWQAQGAVTVLTTGVSGTWFGTLNSSSNLTTNPATVNGSSESAVRTDGTGSIVRDTTVSQLIYLTGQWSATSASNICVMYGWNWERIG